MEIQTWIKVAAFTGSGLAVGLGAVGAGIGEGYAAARANEAISRTPDLGSDILKIMLLGQAIAESSAIFALLIAMMTLFGNLNLESTLEIFVLFSTGLCMGLGAIGSGIGAGLPVGSTCVGIARQPLAKDNLLTSMLLGSAVTQTPAIFALVTSLILMFSDFSSHPFSPTWAAILGAGVASGLSAIGPAIGEGLVSQSACEGISRHPANTPSITNVMFLGMAVSETTAIYGLMISMVLIFKSFPETTSLASCMALLGAGLCMGLGAIGPGIGEGLTANGAVKWIARNESEQAVITRTMLVGQAVSETTGVYALVISFVLIFVV